MPRSPTARMRARVDLFPSKVSSTSLFALWFLRGSIFGFENWMRYRFFSLSVRLGGTALTKSERL